jgi:hypothetical protein
VGLIVEVSYQSAAGLQHEYETQLRLGGLFVPVAAPGPLEPFEPVVLLLSIDGAAPLRVATRLTVAGADSLCVEVLPEGAAALAEGVAQLCENCDASASKDRTARLLTEEPHAHERRRPEPGPLLDRKIAALSVGEKIRLATNGSRDERAILGRDRAGVVQAALIRNPKTTVDEVLALARSPHLAPEAAETMLEHPTYGASTQIAFALVRNPRTPIPLAVATVQKLLPSDLRVVAKGLGVRQQVAQAARRKLLG